MAFDFENRKKCVPVLILGWVRGPIKVNAPRVKGAANPQTSYICKWKTSSHWKTFEHVTENPFCLPCDRILSSIDWILLPCSRNSPVLCAVLMLVALRPEILGRNVPLSSAALCFSLFQYNIYLFETPYLGEHGLFVFSSVCVFTLA